MDTVAALLDRGAEDDAALLTVDGVTLTWAELRHHVARLADQLRANGIGPGDRFARMMADNDVDGAIVPDLPLEEAGPWCAARSCRTPV